MRMFTRWCWLFGGLSLTLGMTMSTPAQPVMMQGTAAHTGETTSVPLTRLNGVKFTVQTGGPVRSTPVVYEGRLFFGSGDGFCYAVRASTGKVLWRYATNGPVHSSPAVDGSVVYFTSRDRSVYALSTGNGSLIWKTTFGADLPYKNGFDYYVSSPTVEDGMLYVGGGDGFCYALDTRSGTIRWNYNASSRIRSTPAVSGSLVVFGTMDGVLYALDKKTGSFKWKFETLGATLNIEDFGFDRSAIVSSPSIADGIVTVGSRDGFVYAVDLQSGTLKWKYDQHVSWAISTPGRTGTHVLVGSSDARFYQSIDEATGREEWRLKTRGAVWSSPSIAGGTVSFGDLGGYVYGVSEKGTELWQFKTSGSVYGSPLVHDGIVYCGSDDGCLYALQGTDQMRPARTVHRAVFWEPVPKSNWFTLGIDEWVRDFFKHEGYDAVDGDGLKTFLNDNLDKSARSVVVFASNIIPPSLLDSSQGEPLMQRYLKAGGKMVFLGISPAAWRRDSTGAVREIDFAYAGRALGIKFPGEAFDQLGWYAAAPTADGVRWGLKGWWIGFGWVDESQVTTVLARDEYGNPSNWVKSYGGPEGTGLVQLWIPRDKHVDLNPIRAAVEYGLEW